VCVCVCLCVCVCVCLCVCVCVWSLSTGELLMTSDRLQLAGRQYSPSDRLIVPAALCTSSDRELAASGAATITLLCSWAART